MSETAHNSHKADEAAIQAALKNMTAKGDSGLSDVDAVAGASLGVEGVIEYGRKALAEKAAKTS